MHQRFDRRHHGGCSHGLKICELLVYWKSDSCFWLTLFFWPGPKCYHTISNGCLQSLDTKYYAAKRLKMHILQGMLQAHYMFDHLSAISNKGIGNVALHNFDEKYAHRWHCIAASYPCNTAKMVSCPTILNHNEIGWINMRKINKVAIHLKFQSVNNPPMVSLASFTGQRHLLVYALNIERWK